jgi:phytoene dehydrogenase-like protein
MLIVSQAGQNDPSRAPAGFYVLRIHARAFPAQIRGDAADTISCRNWDRIKEHVADRLVSILEQHTDNLKEAMLARFVMSPLDVERANPNFIGGDGGGGSQQLDQNFFLRPAAGWTRYTTPIDGLFMIGAAQWPGAGINGASGYLLAEKLMARDA